MEIRSRMNLNSKILHVFVSLKDSEWRLKQRKRELKTMKAQNCSNECGGLTSIHVRPLPAKHEEKKSCGCQVIRRAGFAEDVMLVGTENKGNTHKQYPILREYFHPLSG